MFECGLLRHPVSPVPPPLLSPLPSPSPLAPAPLQADEFNHFIRRIDLSTGLVSTLAGTSGASGSANGLGTAASFNYTWGVAMDAAGRVALVVSDTQEGVGDVGRVSRPQWLAKNVRVWRGEG